MPAASSGAARVTRRVAERDRSADATMALPDGLYDLLLTEGLARSLAAIDPISADVLALKGGTAEFLAEVITRQLANILDDVAGDDSDKAKRQLDLVNELLLMLRQRLHAGDGSAASAEVVDLVVSPLRVLRAVQRDQQFSASPEIGLAVPWLFTAGKGSPSLLQEIRRELASSDQVDILVSFITVSGVRKLQDVLQQITAKGAQRPGGHAPAHPHHDLHGRDRGTCAGRARAIAWVRSACVTRRQAHAPACQGLAVPTQDRLRLSLCRQRQPVGCGTDWRARVDGQADSARASGAVREGRRPLRDTVGRQRVSAL